MHGSSYLFGLSETELKGRVVPWPQRASWCVAHTIIRGLDYMGQVQTAINGHPQWYRLSDRYKQLPVLSSVCVCGGGGSVLGGLNDVGRGAVTETVTNRPTLCSVDKPHWVSVTLTDFGGHGPYTHGSRVILNISRIFSDIYGPFYNNYFTRYFLKMRTWDTVNLSKYNLQNAQNATFLTSDFNSPGGYAPRSHSPCSQSCFSLLVGRPNTVYAWYATVYILQSHWPLDDVNDATDAAAGWHSCALGLIANANVNTRVTLCAFRSTETLKGNSTSPFDFAVRLRLRPSTLRFDFDFDLLFHFNFAPRVSLTLRRKHSGHPRPRTSVNFGCFKTDFPW